MSEPDRIAQADLGYHNLLTEAGRWKREAMRLTAERNEWAAECARVRGAVTKADEEITEPMDAAEIVTWLKSHRFTHSDWGSWFEANPDDARQKVNGNAEFHRKVESRYTAMIAGVEALEAEVQRLQDRIRTLEGRG